MAFIKAFTHLKKHQQYVCLECVLYPKMKFLKHCSGPILVVLIGPSLVPRLVRATPVHTVNRQP